MVNILGREGTCKEIVYSSECPLFRGPTVCPVEPLNKGHYGANSFVHCREVVLIVEVKIQAWCGNKCPL